MIAASDTAGMQVNGGDRNSQNMRNGLSFHEYPPSKPFIHDDYRRDVTKPIIAYPESNRQGMIQFPCRRALFPVKIHGILCFCLRSRWYIISLYAYRPIYWGI